MIDFFHTALYTPIYNLLIGFTDILPGYDIGLAVIAATIVIRVIVMPLSFSAIRTQRAVRVMEPELKKIKETHKDNKEAQAHAMLALYKAHNINPFAGILMIFIQIPVIISLYWVFNTKELLTVNTEILYSFIPVPTAISPLFLGLFAVTGASITLAVIAALTQVVYGWYAIPVPKKSENKKPDMQADFGRAMAVQMRFMLPILIGFAAYFTSVAIALYFITSNIIGVVQEYLVRKLYPIKEAESKA